MNAWNQVVQTIAKSGKPVLYVDFQYGGSGGFLVYMAGFLRSQTANVGFVASSRFEDLVEAVKCFDIVRKGGTTAEFVAATAKVRTNRMPKAGDLACTPDPLKTLSTQDCIQRMKESKILAVRDQNAGPADPIIGIPMEWVSFAEVNEAWKAADKDESRAVANRWRKNAAAVIGVAGDARHLRRDVPGHEGRAQEARGQRHHDELPRRLLRRTHSRLSLSRVSTSCATRGWSAPASAMSARRPRCSPSPR